jgi:hypothetical protein
MAEEARRDAAPETLSTSGASADPTSWVMPDA